MNLSTAQLEWVLLACLVVGGVAALCLVVLVVSCWWGDRRDRQHERERNVRARQMQKWIGLYL
jgi:hypothetical protein